MAFSSNKSAAITFLRELTASRILRQTGWLAIARIIQGLSSILATFIVARHLGPVQFGQLSLAVAIASFVATAAALGLEHIATRELVAAIGSQNHQRTSALQRLRIFGAGAGSLLLLGLIYLPYVRNFGISGVLLVLCLLPLAQIGDVAEWRLVASEQSKRVAVVTIALSPTMALVRLWWALSGGGIEGFAWILILEWTLRSALLAAIARSNRGASAILSQAAFVTHALPLLRDAIPLLLAGVAVFVYMRIDQFMIAAILGPEQVGLYSAVVVLVEAPLILPVLLLRTSLPALSAYAPDATAARDRRLLGLMRAGFYFHALVALLLCVLAEPIMLTLYGEAFRAAIPAFRIQVLAVPFVALGVLSSAWLILNHHTGHALRRSLWGAVSNIALNLLLIPRMGIAGAAMATLAAQVIAAYIADLFTPATIALFQLKTAAMKLTLRDRP